MTAATRPAHLLRIAGTALVGLGVGLARPGVPAAAVGWVAFATGGCGAVLAFAGVGFIPGWVQLATLLLAAAGWQLDAPGRRPRQRHGLGGTVARGR